MKKFLSVLSVFAILLYSCGGNKTNEKTDENTATAAPSFKSEKFNFEAAFPATPTETTEATPTQVGNIDLTMFIHDAGDKAYFVGISDMPKALIENADKNALLQGGKTGALGNIENSKILSEKNITINSHPGLEFEAEGATQGIEVHMKGRFYLVENRLYQVYIMAQKGSSDKEEMTKFVESFKLLK